jgi:hypothetical protein
MKVLGIELREPNAGSSASNLAAFKVGNPFRSNAADGGQRQFQREWIDVHMAQIVP